MGTRTRPTQPVKHLLVLAAVAGIAILCWTLAAGWDDLWTDGSGAPTPSRPEVDEGPRDGERPRLQGAGGARDTDASTRLLRLALRRHPDDTPVCGVPLDLTPCTTADGDALRATDDAGCVTVEVPSSAGTLKIDATGFEPAEIPIDAGAEVIAVVLVPSSGLYGRVVLDGEPVAGAQVRLTSLTRVLRNLERGTRGNPRVQSYMRRDPRARAATNERGAYYLPCETRIHGSPFRVTAYGGGGLTGSLEVVRSRPSAALEDIVLGGGAELVIHVVDEEGAPIERAYVHSARNPLPWEDRRTGVDGTVTYPAPQLPSTFSAGAEGRHFKEMRIDGRTVPWNNEVTSCEQHVEIVLAPVRGTRVRIVDAETRLPLFLVRGRVELLREGERVGYGDFQVDARGEAWVAFAEVPRPGEALPQPADTVRLHIQRRGYEQGPPHEIDARVPPSTSPVEIALQPKPGTVCLRGRVLRDGAPVADLQIGMKVQPRSQGMRPRTWRYERAYTNDQGRFSLRWEPYSEPEAIAVSPHRPRNDEFGFIGPLHRDEALEGEHTMELRPSTPVPAILRNIVHCDRYCYYVSILDEDVGISTTVNGLPIAVGSDGDARTTILLPRGRRVSVTIGHVRAGGVYEYGSPPVVFDSRSTPTPLVFEVDALFANISGHVVGFTDDETRSLGVAFVPKDDSSSEMVRIGLDGSFHLVGVPRGPGQIFLLRDEQHGATVLARKAVEVDDDIVDLRLSCDPESLQDTGGR